MDFKKLLKQASFKKLIIALDFDETYTAAPTLWNFLIREARSQGIEIICVTMRHDTPENRKMIDLDIPVYFTGLKAKRPYMEMQGVNVNIWIDDSPEYVNNDY